MLSRRRKRRTFHNIIHYTLYLTHYQMITLSLLGNFGAIKHFKSDSMFFVYMSVIGTRSLFEVLGKLKRKRTKREPRELKATETDSFPLQQLPIDLVARLVGQLALSDAAHPDQPQALRALEAASPSLLAALLAASEEGQWRCPDIPCGQATPAAVSSATGRVLWTLGKRRAAGQVSMLSAPIALIIPADLPKWQREALAAVCASGLVQSVGLTGVSQASSRAALQETFRVAARLPVPVTSLTVRTEASLARQPRLSDLLPARCLSVQGLSSVDLDCPWNMIGGLPALAEVSTLQSLSIRNTHIPELTDSEHIRLLTSTGLEAVIAANAASLRSFRLENTLVHPLGVIQALSAATGLEGLSLGWFKLKIGSQNGGLWVPPHIGVESDVETAVDFAMYRLSASLRSLRFSWPHVVFRPDVWLPRMPKLASLVLDVKVTHAEHLSILFDMSDLKHLDLTLCAAFRPGPLLRTISSLPLKSLRLSDIYRLDEQHLAWLRGLAPTLHHLELVRCGPYTRPAFPKQHQLRLAALLSEVSADVVRFEEEAYSVGDVVKRELEVRRKERALTSERAPAAEALASIAQLTKLRTLSLRRCEFLENAQDLGSSDGALQLLSLRHLRSLTLYDPDDLGWPTHVRQVRYLVRSEVRPRCLDWRIWDPVTNDLPSLQLYNGGKNDFRYMGLTPRRAQSVAGATAALALFMLPPPKASRGRKGDLVNHYLYRILFLSELSWAVNVARIWSC